MTIETKMLRMTDGIIAPPRQDPFHIAKLICNVATEEGKEGWELALVLEVEGGRAVYFQRKAP